MIELVPFLVILWISTSTLGIKGAAIAWTLRCAADALALFWVSGINR
jgi:Na+-driven multidrug efflux pump